MLSCDEIFLFELCQDANSNIQSLMWALSNRVNINIVNSTGTTPLHYCVKNNRIDFVQHLLQAGAYLNSQDNDGNTLLHFAIEQKLITLIHLLSIAGASFKVINRQGKTPQDLALASSNKSFIDSLAEYRQRLKYAYR